MKTTTKTSSKGTASKSKSTTTAKAGNSKSTASKATASKATASKSAPKTMSNGKMKPKQSAAEGLRELYVDSLKDIYWAEKALLKALPKMAKNATSQKLKMAIEEHIAVTEEQAMRLEKVFELAGKKATAKKCEAMDGLIKEGQDIMESTEPGPVRDAGIISASQKIEHYEIATYGTLRAFANTLGETEAVSLLEQTLNEEKEADVTLTEAAYNDINFEAHEEDEAAE
jgi:ferritin-like metal-binding protein YciE